MNTQKRRRQLAKKFSKTIGMVIDEFVGGYRYLKDVGEKVARAIRPLPTTIKPKILDMGVKKLSTLRLS